LGIWLGKMIGRNRIFNFSNFSSLKSFWMKFALFQYFSFELSEREKED
jgi:hypothetical protein